MSVRQPEVLSYGGTRPARRGVRVTIAALAVLMVLLAGSDQWLRHREFLTLLTGVESGQSAVTYADGRVRSMVQYTYPLVISIRTSPEVREGLRRLVQDAAAERVPALRERRNAVARLSILPWHTAQRRALTAYVAYLDARVAYLEAIADRFGQLFVAHPELQRRMAVARAALLAAAPWPGDAESADRILPAS